VFHGWNTKGDSTQRTFLRQVVAPSPHAASIANRYKADLTVFHVVETLQFEKHLVGYISEQLWNEIKTRNLQEAREILSRRKRDDASIEDAVDQFCQQVLVEGEDHPYVTYEIVVKTGDPVEEIIKEAHRGTYDLVVIGEHSRRVVKDALKRKVGSTAWRIFTDAKYRLWWCGSLKNKSKVNMQVDVLSV